MSLLTKNDVMVKFGLFFKFVYTTDVIALEHHLETPSQSNGEIDTTLAPRLIVLLGRLLTSSSRLRQQSLHERGFLLISQALEKSSPIHLTGELLQELIRMVEKIEQLPNNHGPALLRQMADYILFNPALWCRAPANVQIELQRFLATQFIQSKTIQSSLRRVSTTLIFLHALKYYYWLTNPSGRFPNSISYIVLIG